jgi:hypothetical protein
VLEWANVFSGRSLYAPQAAATMSSLHESPWSITRSSRQRMRVCSTRDATDNV